MINIDELSRRAVKGDRQSIDDLCNLAAAAAAASNTSEAIHLYQEATTALRISVFREKGAKEAALDAVADLSKLLSLIEQAIELTNFVPPLQARDKQLDSDLVTRLLLGPQTHFAAASAVVPIVANQLTKHKVGYSTAEASIPKHLTSVLLTICSHGSKRRDFSIWSQDPILRMAVHYVRSLLEKHLQDHSADGGSTDTP